MWELFLKFLGPLIDWWQKRDRLGFEVTKRSDLCVVYSAPYTPSGALQIRIINKGKLTVEIREVYIPSFWGRKIVPDFNEFHFPIRVESGTSTAIHICLAALEHRNPHIGVVFKIVTTLGRTHTTHPLHWLPEGKLIPKLPKNNPATASENPPSVPDSS